VGRKSPLTAAMLSCGVLLVGLAVGAGLVLGGALTGCGTSSNGGTTATEVTSASTFGQETTTSTQRTITSSTEPIEPPILTRPFTRLETEIQLAGIQVVHGENSGGHGNLPGLLFLEALAQKGQDVSAYQGIAEKMLSLAEKYKQELYFDRLHVVLVVAQGGEVLYDRTFQVTPPSSTTSTTLPFIIRYSAPSLEVRPRQGVTVNVSVSDYWGTIVLDAEVINDSSSAFHFSRDDLQLYVNDVRIEPTQDGADMPTAIAAPGSGGSMYIYFSVGEFDPYAAGILYISSDPQSQGFTVSDGPT